MPLKDKKKYRNYMREYMKEYRKRERELIRLARQMGLNKLVFGEKKRVKRKRKRKRK